VGTSAVGTEVVDTEVVDTEVVKPEQGPVRTDGRFLHAPSQAVHADTLERLFEIRP
jgi:hypothetical protein